MENTNDCFAFTVEQYIGKRCAALKKSIKAVEWWNVRSTSRKSLKMA